MAKIVVETILPKSEKPILHHETDVLGFVKNAFFLNQPGLAEGGPILGRQIVGVDGKGLFSIVDGKGVIGKSFFFMLSDGGVELSGIVIHPARPGVCKYIFRVIVRKLIKFLNAFKPFGGEGVQKI